MRKVLFSKIVMCLAIVSLAVGCKDYDDDINDLNATVTTLQASLTAKTDELSTLIASTKTALEAKDTEFAASITALETSIDDAATKAELATAVSDLTALAATKAELAAAVQTLTDASATKAELAAAILASNEADDAFAAEMLAFKAEFNAFKVEASAVIATLATKAELQTQIARFDVLLAQVADLSLRVDANEGDITTLKAEVLALVAKVDALKTEINSVLAERLNHLIFVKELSVGGDPAINFGVITYTDGVNTIRAIKDISIKFNVDPSTVTNSGIVIGDNAGMAKTNAYTATKAAYVIPDNFPVDVIGITKGDLTIGMKLTDDLFANLPDHDALLSSEDALEFAFCVRHSDAALINDQAPANSSDVEFNGELVNEYSFTTTEYIRAYKTVDQIDIVRPYATTSTVDYCDNDLRADAAAVPAIVSGAEELLVADPLVARIPVSTAGSVVYSNLTDYVAPLVNSNLALNYADIMSVEDLAKYGLKFKFDLLDKEGNDIVSLVGAQDQQEYINLSDEDNGTINSIDLAANNLALGKTPIVHVSILDMNNANFVVTEAFVKVVFVLPTITFETTFDDLVECPKDNVANLLDMTTVEADMATNVYDKTGLSIADFINTYSTSSATLYVGGVASASNMGTYSAIDAATGTITWELNEAQLRAAILANPAVVTSGDILDNVVTYVDPLNQYPNVDIHFITKWTAPTDNFNIAATSLISNVWDLTNTSITQHTVNPSAISVDPASCTYVNDILVTFVGNAFPSGLLNPKFAFRATQDDITIDGVVYTFSVDASGTILSVTTDAQPLVTEVVATLSGAYNKTVTYSDSDLAKILLNNVPDTDTDKKMSAKVIVTGVNCLGQALNSITINEQEYFTIDFVRPVSISEVLESEYIYDSENFGTDKQIIGLDELAHLFDWRLGIAGYDNDLSDFTKHDNYYDYYDVTSISVDPTKVKTNMNQADGGFVLLSTVTNAINIQEYQPAQAVGGVYTLTGLNNGVGVTATVNEVDYSRGLIAYNSNGIVINTEFKLQIPVTVAYLWGTTTTYVTVIVKP